VTLLVLVGTQSYPAAAYLAYLLEAEKAYPGEAIPRSAERAYLAYLVLAEMAFVEVAMGDVRGDLLVAGRRSSSVVACLVGLS
jgi:hypothetical protein